ncbi:MAG: DUF5615 family PIN-like protein [bacterium]
MSVKLYMDTHIPRAVTLGLRIRGVDVLTAQEDGTANLPDPQLLVRATQLERVLFTFDRDFFKIASDWQKRNQVFPGLVYAKPLRISIGKIIEDLDFIAKAAKPQDLENQILFLPL